jgi:cellulose synthase/poly-beta-1,6-N-acetylglucosamine synthase-like glycosyltransferase
MEQELSSRVLRETEVAPLATVVVPAHNAAATLPDCLRALAQQTLPQAAYEVLVVDDGSTDSTAAVAQALGVRVLRQPHRGAAAARNLGARHARGGLLCFTDADCRPAPDWLAQLVAPFQADPAVVGVRGVYRSEQREPVARLVQLEYEDRYRRTEAFPQIDFVDTYSAAYRTDLFLAQGGFDESFPGASVEDQELSFRLAERGCRLVFQPRAAVYHRHPATWRAYARKKFRIGYWKVQVLWRHPQRVAGDTHTPPVVRWQVGLAGMAVLGLVLAPFWPWAGVATGGAAVAFVASAVPFLRFVRQRDPALGPLVLPFVAVRALALGWGLACGVLGLAFRAAVRRRDPRPGQEVPEAKVDRPQTL